MRSHLIATEIPKQFPLTYATPRIGSPWGPDSRRHCAATSCAPSSSSGARNPPMPLGAIARPRSHAARSRRWTMPSAAASRTSSECFSAFACGIARNCSWCRGGACRLPRWRRCRCCIGASRRRALRRRTAAGSSPASGTVRRHAMNALRELVTHNAQSGRLRSLPFVFRPRST